METNVSTAQPTEEEGQDLNFESLLSEEVKPFYHNAGIIEPPYKLFRINSSAGRVYFRFQNEALMKNPILYMGTGSITSQIPTSRELMKYKAKLGWTESEREMSMWSLYGSFSDTLIANFIQKGKFENGLGGLPLELRNYFYWQRFFVEDFEFNHMAKCIQKDMIGFEKFVYDRKVEFFFVEYPVVSEIDGVATPIDFGCFFDSEIKVNGVKKDGSAKKTKDTEEIRVCGLFNYKSGKIYPNYGVQCKAERTMFMESYPEFTTLPIRSYNLTIRDFKSMNWEKYRRTTDYGKPYQIKDWTDEVSEDKYRHYLELAKMEREKRLSKKITTIEGDIQIGEEPSQYVVTKTIKDIIEDGSWQKYAKSNAQIPSEFLQPLT